MAPDYTHSKRDIAITDIMGWVTTFLAKIQKIIPVINLHYYAMFLC